VGGMSRSSVHDLAAALAQRYQVANRAQRKEILDEFLALTNYHRKSAIRILASAREEAKRAGSGRAVPPRAVRGSNNATCPPKQQGRRGRPRVYDPEVVAALQALWESADYICSRRLQPFASKLLAALRRHGELELVPEVEAQLCRMSSSTMDRLLHPYRLVHVRRGLSTTKPGTLLRNAIPVRTFTEWDDKRPGFFEGDLVAHCGESTEGFYLCTLSMVDVATGWSECGVKARTALGAGLMPSSADCHSQCWAWTPTMAASSSIGACTITADVTRSHSLAHVPTRKTISAMSSRRTGRWYVGWSATIATVRTRPWHS